MFYKFLQLYYEQEHEVCIKTAGYFYYGKIVQLYTDCLVFHTEVDFDDGEIKDKVEMVIPIHQISLVYKTLLSFSTHKDMEETIHDLIKDEVNEDSTD